MSARTLVAQRKSLFSWDFTVMDGPAAVAEIDMSWWRDKGTLTVERREYPLHREGLIGGAFVLEGDDAVLARAERLHVLSRTYEIEHHDRHWLLKPRGLLSRHFVLLAGDAEVGSIMVEGVPSRRLRADLPEEMPLPVMTFVIWLVVLVRKRRAKAASHGGH